MLQNIVDNTHTLHDICALWLSVVVTAVHACRLLSFTREKDHTHKGEVSQILFPVFVHFYLDLLSSSHTDTGGCVWVWVGGWVGVCVCVCVGCVWVWVGVGGCVGCPIMYYVYTMCVLVYIMCVYNYA